MQWNPEVLDRHIAPGISSFTGAVIPDIRGQFPEADFWLANYFLNTVLGPKWADGFQQVAVAFMRRANHAHANYHEARELTLGYLDGNDPLNPRIRTYYAAVSKWETFAIEMTMASDLFRWINLGRGAFEKHDGSKEQRLYTIGNHVKHVASCVESGQCTEHDTLPLWITSADQRAISARQLFVVVCALAVDV